MPKENTHLWFAESLVGKTRAEGMRVVISGGKPSYCLGSIIPDTFYYSFSPSLERISEIIHGRDGRPTNALILSVLDEARGPDDIAFILGYITHCALDITFHPMVESLSGNYYDQDPARREDAVTRHRFLETCIDVRTGNTLRIHELVRPRLLRGLVFEDIVSRDFRTTRRAMERTLLLQLVSNRLFASPAAYLFLNALQGWGVLHARAYLSLFYGGIRDSCSDIQDPVRYRDRSSGAELVETLSALFARARSKALPMMEAAWGYSEGTVSREQLVQIIPGENLSTGELPGKTPRD